MDMPTKGRWLMGIEGVQARGKSRVAAVDTDGKEGVLTCCCGRDDARSLREEDADALEETDWFVGLECREDCRVAIRTRMW